MKHLTKIIFAILVSTFISLQLNNFVLADCDSNLHQFCVTEELKLPNTYDEKRKIKVNQQQSYFNDTEHSPLVSFALRIIDFALRVIGPLAVLMVILAGIFMLISRGESQNIDEAKDQVSYALLGLVFAFLSYIIVVFIQSLFGFQT